MCKFIIREYSTCLYTYSYTKLSQRRPLLLGKVNNRHVTPPCNMTVTLQCSHDALFSRSHRVTIILGDFNFPQKAI